MSSQLPGQAEVPAGTAQVDQVRAGSGSTCIVTSLRWDYYRDGTRMVTWFESGPEPLA